MPEPGPSGGVQSEADAESDKEGPLMELEEREERNEEEHLSDHEQIISEETSLGNQVKTVISTILCYIFGRASSITC